MICLYLGCESRAVYRITAPRRAVPWLACRKHHPAMAKALSIGYGFSDEADVTLISTGKASA